MNKLSHFAEEIIGSEIIALNQKIKDNPNSKDIFNYTIGDFDPTYHPIPSTLKNMIIDHYENDDTNYPPSQGIQSLRESLSDFYSSYHGYKYGANEFLIGGGVRPLIYTIFKTILSPSDLVIYAVPSWNNNHYSFLHDVDSIEISTKPENNFLLLAKDIKKFISIVHLICLCSPQNPTGATYTKEQLKDIIDLVLAENEKRKKEETNYKPVYIFFDQIYNDLSHSTPEHPLLINENIKEYLICADGISKSLCATGVRVGWIMAPYYIIDKATQIYSHIGAWAPKPEQLAVARYLKDIDLDDDDYVLFCDEKVKQFSMMQQEFINILNDEDNIGKFDYIQPGGGIYLTIMMPYNKYFTNIDDFMTFLINECNFAMVPFKSFGVQDSEWFRISFGTSDPFAFEPNKKNFKSMLTKFNMLNGNKI